MMIRSVAKTTNWEYSIKMIASLVLGLLVTKLIGFPNVVTIPITAYLVCWSYRGARGAVEYFGFRLRIQLIFVIVDTLAWYGLTCLWPNSLAWHRFALLGCILVPIYIQVYYRFKILPLNLTAIFSTLIILAGLMGTPDYGVRRIIWNICGLVIGCALTFLIPGLTKLTKVRQSLLHLSELMMDELERMERSGTFTCSPAILKTIPEAAGELAAIAAYLAAVDKDLTRSSKFPMRIFPATLFGGRYENSRDEIEGSHKLLSSTNALLALISYVRASGGALELLSTERKKFHLANIEAICQTYRAILTPGTSEVPPLPALLVQPEHDEELLLLTFVLSCAENVTAFLPKAPLPA